MFMKKVQLMESIQDLPEDFNIDDLIERLVVIQKIESRQQEVREGKTLTEDEAKAKLEKWLK